MTLVSVALYVKYTWSQIFAVITNFDINSANLILPIDRAMSKS